MRLWNSVKTMEEVVDVTNVLMRNNIKFFMEYNDMHDSITIVILSRKASKIEICKEIGFLVD